MIEGRHFQNAYLRRNMRSAIELFEARADIRKLLQFEATTEVMTPSGSGIFTNKLAFIWIGDFQYELIEPVSGSMTLYLDQLPADDSLLFHHVCMRVDEGLVKAVNSEYSLFTQRESDHGNDRHGARQRRRSHLRTSGYVRSAAVG
jgi:hypothetical protein